MSARLPELPALEKEDLKSHHAVLRQVIAFIRAVRPEGALPFLLKSDASETYAAIKQQAWQNPGLENSWANRSGGNPAGYYKDTTGRVHLRGYLDSGTASNRAFRLPAGYRPPNHEFFAGATSGGVVQIEVGDEGEVVPGSYTTYISLDGISFRAE